MWRNKLKKNTTSKLQAIKSIDIQIKNVKSSTCDLTRIIYIYIYVIFIFTFSFFICRQILVRQDRNM